MADIVRDSEGTPTIAGTEVRVVDVARAYEHGGHSPDEITSFYGDLTLGDVHTALAYYFDNLEEFYRQSTEATLELHEDEEPEFVAYGIGLYVLGEATVGQAAERAGVSRSRMSDLLSAAGIEVTLGSPGDTDEFQETLDAADDGDG